MRKLFIYVLSLMLAFSSMRVYASSANEEQRALIAQVQHDIWIQLGGESTQSVPFAEQLHPDAMQWLTGYWIPPTHRVLLFWSSGLTKVNWPLPAFIAALEVDTTTQKAQIIALQALPDMPAVTCDETQRCYWQKSCFWQIDFPTASNPVDVLLRYLHIGGSGSTYDYWIIAYNRYLNTLEMKPFAVHYSLDLAPQSNIAKSVCSL